MGTIGLARIGDISIGTGTHGLPCCPHTIIGVIVTGSPNTNCNNKPVARKPDIVAHSCPHCGIGVTLTAATKTFCNNIPVHRLNDLVFWTCGIGVTITASPDTFVEG